MSAARWLRPLLDAPQLSRGLAGYVRYLRDWRAYVRMPAAEALRVGDGYPCLCDRSRSTPFDAHYFYQDIWAFKAILAGRPARHVDVGSNVFLVGMLTAISEVTFIDIRPLAARLTGLHCRRGSLLALPFADGSVASLSCLHVAEHVGLGRYGDALDPLGTVKAAGELARVLATGGDLYFSVPVGRPRVCFNAHRIHAPGQVLELFRDLTLRRFAGVNDRGEFREDIAPDELAAERYACGLFHFTRAAPARSGRGD